MASYRLFSAAILIFASVNIASADDWDVDQADSLNFQGFHTDKDAAVKLWKDKESPEKVYEQKPAETQSTSVKEVNLTNPAAPTTAAASASTVKTEPGQSGKRYELRERYTLGQSTHTPYSAFYVIQALHQQMAGLCQQGWRKLGERSEPVDGDFYLYYVIECL